MLLSKKFDLAVLPELFATGYLFTSSKEVADLGEEIPNGLTCMRLQALCKKTNSYLTFGILEHSKGKFYNSAVLLGPKGVVSHYRKLHLFFEEKKWFAPGNLPLQVKTVQRAKVGLMICYDWRFPETARTLALRGADIILHPSNLVLPHCPEAMITRSLENHVYCVTADRTGTERRGGKQFTYIGQSQIVDPRGNVVVRLSKTEEKLAVAEVDPRAARKKAINRYNDLFKDRRRAYYED